MKSMAKAILFSGVILAAQVAMADGLGLPAAGDDNAFELTPRSTYADEHRNDSMTNARNPVANVSPFPSAGDDNAFELAPRSTYADTHLDRSMRPGTDAGN